MYATRAFARWGVSDMPIKTVAAAAEKDLSALIAAVVAVAEKKSTAKKNASLPLFIRQFYAASPPDELRSRDPEMLYDAAARAWDALQKRKVGTAKISVVNAGVDTVQTFVQIINDDMPFLVSSVTCEMERMDMSPLLVVHPVLNVRR